MIANDLLMQSQADILKRTVVRPATRETYANTSLLSNWSIDRTYNPFSGLGRDGNDFNGENLSWELKSIRSLRQAVAS